MAGATAVVPTSLIELTISCRNLRDADVFSVSDPMAIVYHKPFGNADWVELDRTECIDNTLNPDFAKKIKITYFFEEQQQLKFVIYDLDSNSAQLEDHDFLGKTETTLAKLVSAGTLQEPLYDPSRKSHFGSIIVTAEEMEACKEELTVQFAGKDLVNRKWFSKLNPFLEFYKANENGTYVLVHRTEHVKKSSNPVWASFRVPLRSFCSSDYDRTIKVNCKDFKKNGYHNFIGSFTTNVRMLKEGNKDSNAYQLVNEDRKKRKGSSYTPEGHIFVPNVKVSEVYSFLDYIKGGTDLNAFIAIDFTASNGDPRDSKSLHYISSAGRPNEYQQAIKAVGEIIEDYDTDKYFPVLGFGARMPPNFDKVSHLFFANGDDANPFCLKVQGVLDAYQSCINRVQLYGPTNFAPIIKHVAQFAEAHKHGDKYFILLMITDGIITDMDMTKREIVNAADLPLSIIIVGVGDADFDAMEELDGDTVRVSYNGRKASRDIVQFVPFRDFLKGLEGRWSNYSVVKRHLAREVLAEIPDQFISFMQANKIKPGEEKTSNLPMNPAYLMT